MMEDTIHAPETYIRRRKTPVPLGQLVEKSKNRANIPNHLLETKIFAKMKSSALIQAEPSELHFSGFEPGKEYLKSLKLINVSSEVMNIHIIPTQTENFHTTYTKKYRLIPGLFYTVDIHFCPDEWRYFHDCVRVHCKGEENLFIPVHAYPVIDDLHIPPRIDLPAVPIGHRVIHAIPLRCSCPIDFEFQLYIIQPHEAFSIHLLSVNGSAEHSHDDGFKRSPTDSLESFGPIKTLETGFGSSDPLKGVIPANGEVKIIVTFSPIQYETAQLIIQLVICQFNTKPFLCTITGSSAPHLALREMMQKSMVPGDCKVSPPKVSSPAKGKYRAKKDAVNLQCGISDADAKAGADSKMDACTPAGVSKMLIKDSSKLTSKELRDGSCMVGLKTRQLKEAFFREQVTQYARDEDANRLKRQVHLGKDPVSAECRRQILNEREIALKKYMERRGDVSDDQEFVWGQPRLSSVRVLCDAGQTPTGSPSFQFYSSFNWELKHRVLRLFQQAARKVIIRCRMNRRLALLKKSRPHSEHKVEEKKMYDWMISPDQVFASSFPIFSEIDDIDQLVQVPTNLETLPVDHVTMQIPSFELQIPEHYRIMGYRIVTTWDAFSSYIPTTLARPLRTDNLVIKVVDQNRGEEAVVEEKTPSLDLDITFPEALLKPVAAHPLRIFNPAPGLQTYKPTPKYLESDLEYHLCPLPRYPSVDNSTGKRPERKVTIEEILTWKNFDSITTHYLSTLQTQTTDFALRSCVDYNPDILPVVAPPVISSPLVDMSAPEDEECENSGIQLTPQMIRAEFLSGEVAAHLAATLAGWQLRERQIEATYKPEFNQMGKRVMAKLKQLGPDVRPSTSSSQVLE